MKHIAIENLHPHPRNPRLGHREDIVDQIAGQLNGAMDEAHALIVRPNAAGFEIISGHHRFLAAQKVGLQTVPCWVREMTDEEAYMALVLCNAQSELLPIEVGFHQLGSNMTVRDYAAKVGVKEQTLSDRVHAARVVTHVRDSWVTAFDGTPVAQMEALDRLHGEIGRNCLRHLASIHTAPEWVWPALVRGLMENEWSVDATQKVVKTVAKAEPPEWADRNGIATKLIAGDTKASEVAKFEETRADAEKRIKACGLEVDRFVGELGDALQRAIPSALSEVQAICQLVIDKQAELERARRQEEIEAKRKEEAANARAARLRRFVSLDEWKELDADTRRAILAVGESGNVPTFNKQEGPDIEWAQWSWNPITGCLHDCPYCYARDIANQERMAKVYPNGFAPTLHPLRLLAPQSMKVPEEARKDHRFKNVFTGSMADIFGRWVPTEWIEAVLAQVRAAPQWNFLFLTKFPGRMADFEFPDNAWVGTSVDLQARVNAAEKAFAKINAKTKWLSVEPMLEPLRFHNLQLFRWVVIGGAARSSKTPDWRPPAIWWIELREQARAAGCAVYAKSNLLGNPSREGLCELPIKAPISEEKEHAPDMFDYLKPAK